MTAFPAALFPWSANCAEQTVCKMKNTNMPAVDMRKSGLRPTLSQNRPPEIAFIADHTLRNALISSCSVLLVTAETDGPENSASVYKRKAYAYCR